VPARQVAERHGYAERRTPCGVGVAGPERRHVAGRVQAGGVLESTSVPASRLRDPAISDQAADGVRATARLISTRLGAPERPLLADASR
jgi:hypothetical protein